MTYLTKVESDNLALAVWQCDQNTRRLDAIEAEMREIAKSLKEILQCQSQAK